MKTPRRARAITCDLTTADAVYLADLMRKTGITTDANAIRLGLWHLARHLDVTLPPIVFAQRHDDARSKP